MSLPRIVAPETLDHLAADDPAARRSRRDLARVHHVMRTRALVRAGWQALVAAPHGPRPLRVLELGAGDGSLMLGVARSLGARWPRVRLTLLDRLDVVSCATLQGYAALGWTADVRVQDALDWADDAAPSPPPEARWDLITTALFLHHFESPALRRLLAAVAAQGDRFLAVEPRRGWRALAGSHLVGLLGANDVTREDAVLSVHAGFRGHEIGAHWPPDGGGWWRHEAASGPFSHRFCALREGLVA